MSLVMIKIANGELPTDDELASELYNICDEVHSSCSDRCPVYAMNGGRAPGSEKPFKENRGCDTFKDGALMLLFLRTQEDLGCHIHSS